MKRLVWSGVFLAFVLLGTLCAHGTAQAASCSMQSTSLSDLLANYDPVKASTSGTDLPSGATLTFVCTGITSNTVVKVFVSGAANLVGAYTPPFLSGPNGFALQYSLCVPGTGNCTATSGTIWNNSNPYSVNLKIADSGNVQTIPSFSLFVPQQDAYVGTTAAYTGSLYFAFKCGSPATAC